MMRLYCWSAGAVVAVWSTVLVGSTSAAPSVYLSSPTNGGSYLIPQTTTTTSIALEYQLFGITDTEEYSQYELCFDVVARKEGKKAVDWTCISSQHRQLVMKDLGSGEYLLTGTLQRLGSNGVGNQVLEETRVTSIFTIYSYEEASPQLQLVAVNNEAVEHTAQESRIALAANPTTSKADLSVQYGYTTSLLDHAFFATCASIEDNDKKVVLPWTCLAAKDRQFTLNNIHIGNYNLHLMLRDIRLTGDASYLLRSKVQKAIDVKAMDDVLPRLTILNPVQEYMLDETTHTAPQVDVQYQLEGSSSVIKQLAVCVEIHKKDTEHSVLLPWNCLPTSSNLFSLSRVPGGEYTVLVVLASNVDNSLQYTSTMQKFTLSIRPAVEFEPTYDWRPLHAWHTIPSGIETRLPIGYGARKEARLPEPWRLQLSMPNPCKYFLRMDVRRHTTIADIMQSAADKCKYPSKCFQVQVNGEVVTDMTLTAESMNLFSASKHLLFDEVCLNEALVNEASSGEKHAAVSVEEVTEI